MLAVRREKVAIIREFQGTAIKVFNLCAFLLVNLPCKRVLRPVEVSNWLGKWPCAKVMGEI